MYRDHFNKTIIVPLLATIVTFLYAQTGWESIGPAGGNLQAMARSLSNESVVYAVSFANPSHVVRSNDAGSSWIHVGLVPDFISCLAIDPLNADIVYAGCSSRVYKSTNGGAEWTSYLLSGSMILDLVIHPSQPQTIRAAGAIKNGFYYYLAFFTSADGGNTWSGQQLITDKKSCGYCIAIDPVTPQTLYLGGSITDSLKNPLVFKSTDGGTSFTDVSNGLSPCSMACAIAVHPTNPAVIYFSTDTGIFRSSDCGNTWTSVSTYRHIYSLDVTPDYVDLVIAGADTTVYISTDTGLSWSASGPQFYGKAIRNVAVSKTESADICAANNVGFFKTTDCGLSWFASNSGMNISAVHNFAVSRQSPATIYMEIDDVGEFKTVDQGATWTMLPEFLSCGSICSFAIHNADPDTVYALEGVG